MHFAAIQLTYETISFKHDVIYTKIEISSSAVKISALQWGFTALFELEGHIVPGFYRCRDKCKDLYGTGSVLQV